LLTDLGEYRPWLKALALAQIPVDLRGRIDPSDIVQQTICEAISDLPNHRGKTKPEFMGWLRSMLRFHLIDAFRALKFAPKVSIDASLGMTDDGMSRLLQANLSSVGHRAIMEEQSIALAKLLEQLSSPQAEAIVLKHCQGMSVDQICRHMNKTPDAVGGLLRHGMRKLRELMPLEE
jgi:RNA polymerase sigma-70 factor (ECF subfamily)